MRRSIIGTRRHLLRAGAAASLVSIAPSMLRAQPRIAPPNIIKAGTLVMSINPTLPPLQYVDDKGETHFRDVEVVWKHEGRGGKTSDTFPATGIIFRETPGSYDYEWHPAPRRQYIINLDGAVSIQASDGETRIIGAGEVLLVEDTSGKGHVSKAVEGKMRHSIFVPIE